MSSAEFNLLEHLGVHVPESNDNLQQKVVQRRAQNDNSGHIQRSLFHDFAGAGVASGSGQLQSYTREEIDHNVPQHLIAHHRRLRAQTGHMDHTMSPRLGHVPLHRKAHAEQKLEDNFDKGMVPMEGRYSCHRIAFLKPDSRVCYPNDTHEITVLIKTFIHVIYSYFKHMEQVLGQYLQY